MSFLSSFRKLFGLGEVRDKGLNSRNIIRDKDPNHVWEIVGELGDGAFGKVYKAHKKDSNELAALKQVEIKAEDDLEDFLVEIDILTKCKHKNVVGLHETYYYGGKLWMFIEFCGGGAVDSIMVDLEKPLKEDQIRYVCHKMCEGLAFIHSQHVIHRDLKAGNVLLTLEGDVKLADFGVSAFNEKTVQKRDSFIGTPYWMAPEVILCETMKDTPYNYKADIWSLGITLIEFAQIEPPNHEMHPMRVLIKIQKADPPTLDDKRKWSSHFHDFLRLCLTKDPEQRPNAVDLLKHPFINTPPDKKVILDLISESKAEVVEIVEDLDDEEDFKEIKRHLNNDSSSDLDKLSQASVDLDKREETPEKQQVKEKLVERKSANEVQPKTDKISVPPNQSKTPDTADTAVSKSDSTSPAIATCLDTDQTLVETLKQPQEAVIKPIDFTLSPSSKNEENAPLTISTESPATSESQAVVSPVKEDVEEQKAPVSPPVELVEEYEDKSSDEGLGASADEKSTTSSQNGSPLKVTEVQNDLTPLASEVEIDLTPLACEIVDEIIEDVLSSTSTDPSVPAVVLAAIGTLLEEDIKVETERGNDIPVDDTDELKPADLVKASDDEMEQVPKRQNSVSEIINNLEKIGQEKHKEPNEIHRLNKRNDSRNCPESESINPQELHEVNEITKPNEVTSAESIVTVTPVVNKNKVKNGNDNDLNRIEEKRENLEVEIGNVNLNNAVDEMIESSNIDDLITINGLPVPAAGTVLLNGSISKMKDTLQDELEQVKAQLPESPKRDKLPKMPHTEYQTDLDTLETKITNTVEPLDISNPDDESSNDKSDAESITTVDSLDKDEVKESPRNKPRGRLKPKGDRENKSQYRTLTKTRTFVVNGEVVVSKVQRVVLAGEEHRSREDHMMRKQDLRELKLLQKNENKQYQDLIYKTQVAREAQERKFETDMQGLVKNFDQDMDILTKQQKQQVEKAEGTQALDQKAAAKKIKTEQEKDFKTFKDKQKQDRKLMQQEFDMIAKASKKDDVRKKKEQKEIEMQEEERTFLENQTERMDKHMKQLTETHRQKIALLEGQYLQQKQQLLRSREASIWELEKQQLLEKHQLAKSQLKDLFFLKRHQMLTRHQKEIEQMKRSNQAKVEEIQHRHLLEKKRLPKILKQESKTRSLMFKQSLRLSITGNTEDERVKLKQFEENEKKRMKTEQARQESKHKKQWEELIARNDSSLQELEQLQAEKRKMLTEHETQKIKELDEQYSNELREWKANLIPRKQKLEEEFSKQREEQERFYGPVVMTSDNAFSRSAPVSMRQKTDYVSSRHSTVI